MTSTYDTTVKKSNEFSFLKSIVEDDQTSSAISKIDEVDDEMEDPDGTPRLSLPPRPSTSRGRRPSDENENLESGGQKQQQQQPMKVNVSFKKTTETDEGSSDHFYDDEDDEMTRRRSRTERWARGQLDDGELEREQVPQKPPRAAHQRRPQLNRPKSGRPQSGRPQSGRPQSGRPLSGRPLSGRPQSGRYLSDRPHSGRPLSGRQQLPQVVDLTAYRLEQKYLELCDLLRGSREDHAPRQKNQLYRAAARMARKYHAEAQGRPASGVGGAPARTPVPVETVQLYSPRVTHLLRQFGTDGVAGNHQRARGGRLYDVYSPRSDSHQDSYILIDGTGPEVKTRMVTFPEPGDDASFGSAHTDGELYRVEAELRRKQLRAAPRGRPPARRGPPTAAVKKKKAWGRDSGSGGGGGGKSSSSSARPAPRQRRGSAGSRSSRSSRSRSRSSSSSRSRSKKSEADYSDSFTSTSSSRSRSSSGSGRGRSCSKGRTVDLHLKYTKNEKLLEWLKAKDELHRQRKRQERRERKEKRKQHREEMEKKEQKKQKSDVAVKNWMKEKQRLLRLRGQQNHRGVGMKEAEGELIVIDETLDLKEHGARIDPAQVPQPAKAAETDTQEATAAGAPEKANDQKEGETAAPEADTSKKRRPLSAHPPPSATKPEGGNRRQQRTNGNMPYSRPTTGRRGRFTSGALDKVKQHKEKVLKEKEEEEKKRVSYDQWLKSKRPSTAKKKDNQKKSNGSSSKQEKAPPATKEEQNKENDSHKEGREEPSTGDVKQVAKKPRPKTAKSAAQKPPTSAESQKAPASKEPEVAADEDAPPSTPTTSASSPRPAIQRSAAYDSVKHEQKSWDEFADHVWKDVSQENEGGEEEQARDQEDRPEPQGSDSPDDVSKAAARPTHPAIPEEEETEDKDEAEVEAETRDPSPGGEAEETEETEEAEETQEAAGNKEPPEVAPTAGNDPEEERPGEKTEQSEVKDADDKGEDAANQENAGAESVGGDTIGPPIIGTDSPKPPPDPDSTLPSGTFLTSTE